MHMLYDLVHGPLLWLTIVLFIGGTIYKIVMGYQEAKKRDPFVTEYWSWPHVWRSFSHWFNPVGTVRWRTRPLLTAATFTFHILIIITPLFLTGHVVLLEQWTGIGWFSLPAWMSDIFTVVVLIICGYFLYRRTSESVAAYVTTPADWFVLGVVFVTFLTGFMANYMIGDNTFMTILHTFSGEVFLVSVPFSRANHAWSGLFMRGYIASEFGHVRKCADW